METIKVNMSPNPLDVQTIHASQNDGEARQWEFELHNNGELIDTSDVKEQMVFKAYKGGTEQLLPENTSTPTTSPFKGDIKYPQGLLTDQEFTYRQSPTTENGTGTLESIRGHTLNWNQIAQLNQGVVNTCTKSYDATTEITTITPTSYESNNIGLWNLVTTSNLKNGHKYYVSIEVKPDFDVSVTFGFGPNVITGSLTSGKFQTVRAILTWTASSLTIYARLLASGWTSGTFQIKNVQCIDLTQMGLDITDPSDFTSLFPLSYYSYNQGSLLSFNGTGIKTVGFNLAESWVSGGTSTPYANALGIEGKLMPNTTYCISFVGNNGNKLYPNENIFTSSQRITCTGNRQQIVLTTLANISKENSAQYQSGFGWRILKNDGGNTVNSSFSDVCMNFNDTSKNGTYEPYTSSTLSLPISTYFPISNEDGTLIGKCTEQLSENPGFIDAKIKLSDADGTCYSNKLQLHVERSPQ